MKKNDIPTLYNAKGECSGCAACYSICPVSAIKMVEDDEGFEYPSVDESLCLKCKMCLKVCPMKNIK